MQASSTSAWTGRMRQLLSICSRWGAGDGEGPPRASSIILCTALVMLGLLLLVEGIQFLIEGLSPFLAAN